MGRDKSLPAKKYGAFSGNSGVAFGDTRPVNPLRPAPMETIGERIVRLENEIIDRDILSRNPSEIGVQLIAARAQITG